MGRVLGTEGGRVKMKKKFMVELEVTGTVYVTEEAESPEQAIKQAESKKIKYPSNSDDKDIEITAIDVWEIED